MNFSYKYFTKISFTVLLSILFSTSLTAQETPDKPRSDFWKNVRFGGGFGLSFGDGFVGGSLSPTGIYQFNPQFGLGVGLTGAINNQKDVYKSTILGGSLIGIYSPLNEIQLSTELEQFNVNRNFDEDFVSDSDQNFWNTALFLGAGYRNGPVTFGIRYDVLYDREKSVYADPWLPFVRVFF